MPASQPISTGSGLLTTTALTEIYKPPGGKTAIIKSVNFSPQDFNTPYVVGIFLAYNNKQNQVRLYYKEMNGGDSVSDTDGMELTDTMSIMAQVSVKDLVTYAVIGEEITN